MNRLIEYKDGRTVQVGTIYCIGRNYAEHAKELGNEVPSEPVVFIKPPNSFVPTKSKITRPNYSNLMHHEVEIVVAIGKDTFGTSTTDALSFVDGIGVGIDFTLRDVQNKIKEKGLPWSLAKSFVGAAPVSPLVNIDDFRDIDNIEFEITKNGSTTQKGNTKDMINDIRSIVSYISNIFGLRKGDLIFTGTPEGVGPVDSGDKLVATISDKTTLEIEIE
jgi:2-keto-4-pentenoate hydratase/2-oxohepta-3-ene-1,7-dioic acid hydratase in catechol pathway